MRLDYVNLRIVNATMLMIYAIRSFWYIVSYSLFYISNTRLEIFRTLGCTLIISACPIYAAQIKDLLMRSVLHDWGFAVAVIFASQPPPMSPSVDERDN